MSTPSTDHNYNSISPSARTLTLLKGLTDIPYAREVAQLISYPEDYNPDYESKDFSLWGRVIHFENRYRSINQLLADIDVENILELSSGYSFRGLAITKDKPVHYIDTDLPDLIDTKMNLFAGLGDSFEAHKGRLEIVPLNAVDSEEFKKVASAFGNGSVAVVNEGLLMYLDIEEKKAVCSNIRNLLREKGGWWITADIYIKSGQEVAALRPDDKLQKFLEEHKVREKMFESFEAAEEFFRGEGFVLDKEAEPEYQNCSTLKYLMQSTSMEELQKMNVGKIHAVWRLKLAD